MAVAGSIFFNLAEKNRKTIKDEPSVEIINVHGKGYKLII